MEKSAKIYIAGHHGLVGSAIWRNLQEKGYTNLTGRSHKELDLLDGVAVKDFFDQERPEYVILAARPRGRYHGKQHIQGGLYLQEPANTTERDRGKLPSRSEEIIVSGKYLHLSQRCTAADEGGCSPHLPAGIYE